MSLLDPGHHDRTELCTQGRSVRGLSNIVEHQCSQRSGYQGLLFCLHGTDDAVGFCCAAQHPIAALPLVGCLLLDNSEARCMKNRIASCQTQKAPTLKSKPGVDRARGSQVIKNESTTMYH